MRGSLPSRAIGAALLIVLVVLLTSCNSVAYAELQAESFSVARFTNYAPIVVQGLKNSTSLVLSAVVITATCYEDQFESLKQEYESAPFRIGPYETIAKVSLEHVDGWPYFTDFKVYCSFDAYNRAFPGEANATIKVR